jgi:aminoglycoside phosphotransferase (APT) family kinase protein
MTRRFTVTGLGPGSRRIEKRGSEEALAREAAALALVAGASWAPSLVARRHGVLVSSRMPGAPRALAALGSDEARGLGSVLRAAHETRRAGQGGLWWWAGPATTLTGYRAARLRDAEGALAGTGHAGLAARAAAAAAAPEPEASSDPFRLLHGDLVEVNIVWDGSSPALVDWEFCRMGDPAEDLAYLVELNAIPPDLVAALLRGYGPPAMDRRVDAWRGLAAADAGAWYLSEGMEAEAAPLLARAAELAGDV